MPSEFIARNGIIALNNSTITGSLNVSGNLTTPGTITAQTLVVQTITSSVSWITGSTQFGSTTANTHQFTGSILQSGSLATFAGSVGIGTSSPAGKFEIKSAAQNYTTAPAITFTDNTGVSDSRWILGNIATTYGAFNLAEAANASSTTYTPRVTIYNFYKFQRY